MSAAQDRGRALAARQLLQRLLAVSGAPADVAKLLMTYADEYAKKYALQLLREAMPAEETPPEPKAAVSRARHVKRAR